ncbi:MULTISPECIES: hypothetical protein [Sphingomonas]|jgi:hypothetical protein|uniref:hypothetical protein n=1 Tax=Sphingomonas TaxID=13687 RepID=UPI00234E6902|nr:MULTISPECIES: hypothetical protein [Sphingomonas]WCP71475.1 hypothetical protein PPZ50_14115 [Sphingomonas hankookensis]
MTTQRLFRTLLRGLALLLLAMGSVVPAQAAVTITFWSQEFGQNFPHAFFTFSGAPDAGGSAVNESYGFTAKAITPALLMGSVGGMIDRPKPSYIAKSNAHFSVVLTDAQYASIRSLIDEWGEKGDSHYNLNRRNCVHFVAEAARRSGLSVVEDKKLMKKPRSFIQSVEQANAGRVTVIEMPAKAYFATLPPPAAANDNVPAVDAATVPH